MKDRFDGNLADSQATAVEAIKPEKFDIEKYAAYAGELEEKCKSFWNSDSGVLVYRRMRVAEVFSAGSRDMKNSLEWQLGALEKSMLFKADIPNFLEPWYGLGVVATAFGLDYFWAPGLAPAIEGKFASTEELLKAPFRPVAETEVGRHNLEMIEYFLDKTKGRLPLSFCDLQSPLNNLSNIIDTSQFYLDFCLDPENVRLAMDRVADLTIDFTRKQQDMIGDALVKPGHGFSSARSFDGIGLSDDSITMLSPDLYEDLCMPAMVKCGNAFGGAVFHSCGNWSDKKQLVASMENLRMADGAFSLATDPGANPTEGFADVFAGTGIVLNTRIVGDADLVEEKVRQLWKPGMKLIVVTYCQTPEEQEIIYNRIHEICQ